MTLEPQPVDVKGNNFIRKHRSKEDGRAKYEQPFF